MTFQLFELTRQTDMAILLHDGLCGPTRHRSAMSLLKILPDAGESGAIPSIFLRLSIFPVGRRPAARPSAGNSNR